MALSTVLVDMSGPDASWRVTQLWAAVGRGWAGEDSTMLLAVGAQSAPEWLSCRPAGCCCTRHWLWLKPRPREPAPLQPPSVLSTRPRDGRWGLSGCPFSCGVGKLPSSLCPPAHPWGSGSCRSLHGPLRRTSMGPPTASSGPRASRDSPEKGKREAALRSRHQGAQNTLRSGTGGTRATPQARIGRSGAPLLLSKSSGGAASAGGKPRWDSPLSSG